MCCLHSQRKNLQMYNWCLFYVHDIRCLRQKSFELIPLVLHFFHQINGIKVKLLEVHAVEFPISDIKVNFTVDTVQKFNMEEKMIYF